MKHNLLREGNIWLRFFHNYLGYRIAEDDEEIKALALAMREILSKQNRKINQLIVRLK